MKLLIAFTFTTDREPQDDDFDCIQERTKHCLDTAALTGDFAILPSGTVVTSAEVTDVELK